MRVAIVGAGYVGLVQAAGLAHLGHDVVLAEIDPARVELLRRGEIPIYEQGLADLVERALERGLLGFTTDNRAAIAGSDLVFLTLPTPQGPDGRADLSVVDAVVGEIAPILGEDMLLVLKSTVPVGTTARVQQRLVALGSPARVVSNPEFLREGNAVEDFLKAERVVIGAFDRADGRRVADLYRGLPAVPVLTDPYSSELTKYGANAYLAARLTFVNSLANLAEAVGADILEVVRGMGLDRRIGPHFLQPGPGYGGSCFPKDTAALLAISDDAGYDFRLLRAVVEVDAEQRSRIVRRAAEMLGGDLAGKRIGLWGMAFKAGTDDTRESPAVKIGRALEEEGALVRAYDPEAAGNGFDTVDDPIAAAKEADLLVVATEWPEFIQVPLDRVAAVMSGRAVLDVRNLLDPAAVRAAGLSYQGLGRGAP